MSDPAIEFFIRPMAPGDLDRVFEIADFLPEAPQWPKSAYEAALDPDAIPNRIALVATTPSSREPVAFAVASLVLAQAELESIVVAGDYQRQGLGRQLFEAVTGLLRSAGAKKLALEVRASNHAALAFYLSLGFTRAGLRPRYYVDPIEDAVLMELPVG
jgi:[ribosomal protein S18]-alanine N-acetyltransferase